MQMVPESHCPPLPLPHRLLCDPHGPPAPLNGLRHRRLRRQVKTYPEQPRHKSLERQEAAGGLQVEAKSTINTYKFHKMFSSLLSVRLGLGSGCFEECVWGSCRGCAA